MLISVFVKKIIRLKSISFLLVFHATVGPSYDTDNPRIKMCSSFWPADAPINPSEIWHTYLGFAASFDPTT